MAGLSCLTFFHPLSAESERIPLTIYQIPFLSILVTHGLTHSRSLFLEHTWYISTRLYGSMKGASFKMLFKSGLRIERVVIIIAAIISGTVDEDISKISVPLCRSQAEFMILPPYKSSDVMRRIQVLEEMYGCTS